MEIFKNKAGYPGFIVEQTWNGLEISLGWMEFHFPEQERFYRNAVNVAFHFRHIQFSCPWFDFRVGKHAYFHWRNRNYLAGHQLLRNVVINGDTVSPLRITNFQWKEGYWMGEAEWNGEKLYPILMPDGQWQVGR